MSAAPPQLSPDGKWWWTGIEWVPSHQAPPPPPPPSDQATPQQPTTERRTVTTYKRGEVFLEGDELGWTWGDTEKRRPRSEVEVAQNDSGDFMLRGRGFVTPIERPADRQALYDLARGNDPAVTAPSKLQEIAASHPEVQVKTYKNERDYERDAPEMARHGWVPQSVVQSDGRVTATRVALVGVFAWAAKKGRGELTVTWVRGPR